MLESDRIVLDRLKSAINYTGPLYYMPAKTIVYKTNNKYKFPIGYTTQGKAQCSLQISGIGQYYQDLLKWYNITPAKSLTLLPPNITDINQIKAYIIGYFDGDGSLMWDKTKQSPRIEIIGTSMLLIWMKSILDQLIGDSFNLGADKRCSSTSTKYLRKQGSSIYKFVEIFSNINVPRLVRKWNIDLVKKNSRNITDQSTVS